MSKSHLKKSFYKNQKIKTKGFSSFSSSLDILSLTMSPVKEDLVLVTKNVKVAHKAIAYTVARVMAYLAVDLLAQALPRTPLAPDGLFRGKQVIGGRLRESGTAALSYQGYSIVGQGNKDGTIRYDYGRVSARKAQRSHKITSNVFFTRFNEAGENIAYWTHELLFPFEDRAAGATPAARTPGTGPKYLEIPFLEHMPRYSRILRDAYKRKTIENIKGLTQAVSSGKKGQATRVKLIESKIKRLGYWG